MSKTRETISYEAVAKVMEALADAGEKATVRRVEAEVGGGSHTTLLGHIKRWKDERRAALAAGPAAGIITHEVSAALVAWTRGREEAARAEANARVSEIDELYRAAKAGWEKADARIEELEAELDKARSAAAEREQALTKETAALQTRIEGADKQLAELKEQLQREQRSNEASRLAAAEARIKADAAQEGIKTLGRANEELLAESRAQGKALGEAERRAAVAEERAINRDEQLAEARAAGSKSANTAEELQKKLSETERKLSVAERELAICREQPRGGRSGEGQGGDSGPTGGGSESEGPRERSENPRDKRSQQGPKKEASAQMTAPQSALMRSLGKPCTDEAREKSLEMIPRLSEKLGHEVMRGRTRYPQASETRVMDLEEARP